MNILVTAIGSMSAECVISSLKKEGHFVLGCDIYPREWHYVAKLCNAFEQAPLAKSSEYIPFLLNLVKEFKIQYLFPLTDLEIDVLTNVRELFLENGCIVCISSPKTITIARDKHRLYTVFKNDINVPSIESWNTNSLQESKEFTDFPYIVKPCDGRSSEGLKKVYSLEELKLIFLKKNYLIQKCMDGPIFTVDYVRQESTGKHIEIPRQELLRTSNGAGITIKLVNSDELKELTHYIGSKLNINGCVNMEFILNDGSFYLIDLNPRFSAGVGYSQMTKNNLVINHLNCFTPFGKTLDIAQNYKEMLLTKKTVEVEL